MNVTVKCVCEGQYKVTLKCTYRLLYINKINYIFQITLIPVPIKNDYTEAKIQYPSY